LQATSVQHALRNLLALSFAFSIAVIPAAAEELVLKSGQKIVGTIVGYEEDMFRVQTEFGFALIRKDKVASIDFAPGSSNEAVPKRADRPRAAATGKAAGSDAERAPASSADSLHPVAEATSVATAAAAHIRTSPAVSRPLNEPLPAQIRERVEGNSYINETFQFAMYKPPGWKVYEGLARETGRAIVAIGAEDEQTLLIVDRQVWSGLPDLESDAAEANLRQTYQDYQQDSESPAQVDGHAAVRRAFQGVLEGVEWHGIAVHVARGNTLFGLIGLTSAETYEFQQALLNKIINSFHFLAVKP